MTHFLGIDTGGTYTDAILFEEASGVSHKAKALTTKYDLCVGIRQAIRQVLPHPSPEIELVSLSTTLATNAIVEGHGCTVGLLLIGYPEDALEVDHLREALGSDPVAFIPGGHQIDGNEQSPLDLDAAHRAIINIKDSVSAFAVSGYFSVLNPSHELQIRDLVRSLTNLPVTCGHELTSNLNAPRRALTAALNARLIPFIDQLICAVKAILEEEGIHAPLMIVKGDGSLVNVDVALERPIETILSGPAASVIGARFLSGLGNVVVADMGGTTTDLSILNDGFPELNRDGATVGGWKTMVEAIAVSTSGLGGDSEVRWDKKEGLVIGPQRVVPLSLLGIQYPEILQSFRRNRVQQSQILPNGRFVIRQRQINGNNGFTSEQAEVWSQLKNGPVPMNELLGTGITGIKRQRAISWLMEQDYVITSAFTPSDAAHVLGYYSTWSKEAALEGAREWAREYARLTGTSVLDEENFSKLIIEKVQVQLGRAILDVTLPADPVKKNSDDGAWKRFFVDSALSHGKRNEQILDYAITLHRPIVAIGAPASTYFPSVAERLHTHIIVPEHAEVANAVGAVVGSVCQQVTAIIKELSEQRGYRLHLPDGIRDFESVDEAVKVGLEECSRRAESECKRAGAGSVQVQTSQTNHVYKPEFGGEIFLDIQVQARAVGRPAVIGSE